MVGQNVEADILQRLGLAVPGIQVFDLDTNTY